jgi:hypothetical protein
MAGEATWKFRFNQRDFRTAIASPSSGEDLPVRFLPSIFFAKPSSSIEVSRSSSSRDAVRPT